MAKPDVEAVLEAVLDRWGLAYDKTEVWIDSEKLFEVLYSTGILWTE